MICLPLGRMAGGRGRLRVDGDETGGISMYDREATQYHFKKAEGGRFKQVDHSGGVGDVIMAGRNQQ